MAVRTSPGTRSSLSTSPLDTVRELNRALHRSPPARSACAGPATPRGRARIAAGLDGPLEVEIDGHVGYYCAGMNQLATVRVRGNCGVGVAENMMSGTRDRRRQRVAVGGSERPRRAAGDPAATHRRGAGSR